MRTQWKSTILGACLIGLMPARAHGALMTTPEWSADINESFIPGAMASAGDVNGDGYSDILIGAPDYDNGLRNEGAAFLWYGGPAGLGPNGTPANADWRAEGEQLDAHFGSAVASAGDVNGDGYSDIIIGAPDYSNGQSREGAAFVWYGGPTGLGPPGTPANAHWRAESNLQGNYFGYSVASAGDVNRDGYSDILIGAPQYPDGRKRKGGAFLWLGSPTGLGPPGTPANAAWYATIKQYDAALGSAVATAGDVNHDGYSDVLISAPFYDNGSLHNEGAVFLWLGGDLINKCNRHAPSGLGKCGNADVSSHYYNADWRAESRQTATADNDVYFGTLSPAAGDVNGDDYSDVLIGAGAYDNGYQGEGAAFLWRGGQPGVCAPSTTVSGLGPCGTPANATWRVSGGQFGAGVGNSLTFAGDVNGDGYSDVLIGAPGYTNGQLNEGAAFLWQGGPMGLPSPGTLANAAWHVEGEKLGETFGWLVAPAGDVNRDGLSDALVIDRSNQLYDGAVLLYYGVP